MKSFIERALKKLPKLDKEQIRHIIRDITGENELLRVVLDSMNDGVLVADIENNLVICSKAAERLLPLKDDFLEKPIFEVISDPHIAEFVRHTLENQDSVKDKEFALESEGGTTRTLMCSIMPLVRSGHVQGNILHIDDVTEKRSREARLRRAESLASLTTLAAGVAHEIKNPLGSIGIHIQLIQKALSAVKASKRKEIEKYINVVNEEVERLNKIVVDFLFAVRPIDIHLEDKDLNTIIKDLLDFVRYEVEEAGIELKDELDDSLPDLRLDEKYLKQALLNIVKNAIYAMPDGGVLRLATERKSDDVLLHIEDSGSGMSEEVMSKIFEPYFTTKDFGSGIGLTLVYKVIKEHLGDISVSSKPGKGSRFTISFPIPQREKRLIDWKGEEYEV
jgi:PAS domain S-box-containing protein